MRFNVGSATTAACRNDRCDDCRGHLFTISADLPYKCDHDCHFDPTDIAMSAAEEMRGDALREESRG